MLEVIAERAAAIVQGRQSVGAEPWLGVREAADHLACPASRIYALVSAGRIPHHRDGSRLLFRRSERRLGGARRRRALALQAAGYSYREIAETLGVTYTK